MNNFKLYFIDFGLTLVNENTDIPNGTPAYVHPKTVLRNKHPTHYSNDIYALCLSYFNIKLSLEC